MCFDSDLLVLPETFVESLDPLVFVCQAQVLFVVGDCWSCLVAEQVFDAVWKADLAGAVQGVAKSSSVVAAQDVEGTQMVELGIEDMRTWLVAFAPEAGRTCGHAGRDLVMKLQMLENWTEECDIQAVDMAAAACVQLP